MTAAEWLSPASLVTAIRDRGPVRRHQLRNFIVDGVRTSVRLDPIFWLCFDRICRDEGIKPDRLVEKIQTVCPAVGLTNAVRTFAMSFTMLHGGAEPTPLALVSNDSDDSTRGDDDVAREASSEFDELPVTFTPAQEEVLRVEMTARPRLAQALMVLIAQYPSTEALGSGPNRTTRCRD